MTSKPAVRQTPRRRLLAGLAAATFVATGAVVGLQLPFVQAEATTGSQSIYWEQADMEEALLSGDNNRTNSDLIVPIAGTAAGIALGALLIPSTRRRTTPTPQAKTD